MTYVIGAPGIDVLDRACVEECPIDCIYEGERSLYIDPTECIDCGACAPVCPVEAIFYEDDLPSAYGAFLADNTIVFNQPPPGHTPGAPGGAAAHGAVGADTDLVANYPARVPTEPVIS